MSTEVGIAIMVSLRVGEEVRLAAGPGFVRIDVKAEGRDREKLEAIGAAERAGVLTPDEARTKRLALGVLVGESHLIATPTTSLMKLSDQAQRATDLLLANVRKRVDQEGLVS